MPFSFAHVCWGGPAGEPKKRARRRGEGGRGSSRDLVCPRLSSRRSLCTATLLQGDVWLQRSGPGAQSRGGPAVPPRNGVQQDRVPISARRQRRPCAESCPVPPAPPTFSRKSTPSSCLRTPARPRRLPSASSTYGWRLTENEKRRGWNRASGSGSSKIPFKSLFANIKIETACEEGSEQGAVDTDCSTARLTEHIRKLLPDDQIRRFRAWPDACDGVQELGGAAA